MAHVYNTNFQFLKELEKNDEIITEAQDKFRQV